MGCDTPPLEFSLSDNIENVIVIVVDTLRANHLGYNGYERDTSPFIDSLAERSVVFKNAYTPRSLTLPSFTCLFSGLHTIRNGIFQNAWPLDDDLHLLTEDFKNAGFTTLGFPASDIMAERYGIARGFDFYELPENLPGNAEAINGMVKGQLDIQDGPFFAFIHFWEPHSPYDPPPDYLEMFADSYYTGPMDGAVETLNSYNLGQLSLSPTDIQHAIDRYDGEVRFIDDHIKNLFDYFDEKGYTENSLIIFAADHGESLGEGHFFQHLRDSEVELHIPLFFHFPNDFKAGRTIPALVENTDIFPTIMEILGMKIPGIENYSVWEPNTKVIIFTANLTAHSVSVSKPESTHRQSNSTMKQSNASAASAISD